MADAVKDGQADPEILYLCPYVARSQAPQMAQLTALAEVATKLGLTLGAEYLRGELNRRIMQAQNNRKHKKTKRTG